MKDSLILTSVSTDELKNLINEGVSQALSNQNPAEPVQKQEENLIKLADVAVMLGVSKVTVHAWKKAGLIPFYRISNKIYFKRNEVLLGLKKIERRKF